MILETKYRLAIYLLQKNEAGLAKSYFEQLAESGYKDSAVMCVEAEYRYAISMANRGYYTDAFKLFVELGSYKNSVEYLLELTEKIYSRGIQYYREYDRQHARKAEHIVLLSSPPCPIIKQIPHTLLNAPGIILSHWRKYGRGNAEWRRCPHVV